MNRKPSLLKAVIINQNRNDNEKDNIYDFCIWDDIRLWLCIQFNDNKKQ